MAVHGAEPSAERQRAAAAGSNVSLPAVTASLAEYGGGYAWRALTASDAHVAASLAPSTPQRMAVLQDAASSEARYVSGDNGAEPEFVPLFLLQARAARRNSARSRDARRGMQTSLRVETSRDRCMASIHRGGRRKSYSSDHLGCSARMTQDGTGKFVEIRITLKRLTAPASSPLPTGWVAWERFFTNRALRASRATSGSAAREGVHQVRRAHGRGAPRAHLASLAAQAPAVRVEEGLL